MPEQPMRGVYPILITPFDDGGRIDEESLGRLVEHNLAAGVHGLGLAMASEILKLTEAERARLVTLVVGQVGGRVPVVVNTGAAATDAAIFYSRRAQELGADALMCQPPWVGSALPDPAIQSEPPLLTSTSSSLTTFRRSVSGGKASRRQRQTAIAT